MADPDSGAANKRGYFGEIVQSAKTIMEGMAITFAELSRSHHNTTTIQYPDRTPIPVADSLPERYRGFLEVDLAVCTGCKACERDCPINVIAIDLEKVGDQRMITRFDIDLGKCMFCNTCVESCPVEAQAPGDREPTKAIRMTREFEGATSRLVSLTFRFVRPGSPVVPFKPKKGETPATRRRGEIARAVRVKAQEYNPVAFEWALAERPVEPPADVAELVKPEAVLARANELLPLVRSLAADPKGIEDLLYNEALAQTDAGHCGYASCREYARALASGRDTDASKCGPGGAQAARDANLILQLRAGQPVEEAVRAAAAATLAKHG